MLLTCIVVVLFGLLRSPAIFPTSTKSERLFDAPLLSRFLLQRA